MGCAVLFADVSGSTALYELLGDERAFGLIENCLGIMSRCTTDAQGRVVKTIGDAVMSVFGTADASTAAAVAMQRQVDQLGAAQGVHLSLRIGFHHGPVVERDGDVFGDTVNLASRLCDLASRGQIITDKDTAQMLCGLYAPDLRALFRIPVKGKEQEVDLIEIAWTADTEQKTLIRPSAATAAAGSALLELELDGARVEMGPQRRKVTFGRDLEADFTVRHPNVSRAHAMIERRREQFVLADHSTNGTFVSFEARPEIKVHHAELTLLGHGWITFGQPRAGAVQVAEFRCVEDRGPAAGA
jgi:adenylate cyclase